jgi:hypothetical protein
MCKAMMSELGTLSTLWNSPPSFSMKLMITKKENTLLGLVAHNTCVCCEVTREYLFQELYFFHWKGKITNCVTHFI